MVRERANKEDRGRAYIWAEAAHHFTHPGADPCSMYSKPRRVITTTYDTFLVSGLPENRDAKGHDSENTPNFLHVLSESEAIS
jgi:hypothetical protein